MMSENVMPMCCNTGLGTGLGAGVGGFLGAAFGGGGWGTICTPSLFGEEHESSGWASGSDCP